jgi:hypothetical protein
MSERDGLDRVLTADEFVELVINDVRVEAWFTEENNESRTLGNYIADLHTHLGRILEGDFD